MSVEHIIKPNGDQFWRMNGQLQREDGPAVIKATGEQLWYFNGLLHRIGGPAIIYQQSGCQEWYFNGLLHREDGPAIIDNNFVSYYINGYLIKREPYDSEIHEKYKYKPGSKTKAAPREYLQ